MISMLCAIAPALFITSVINNVISLFIALEHVTLYACWTITGCSIMILALVTATIKVTAASIGILSAKELANDIAASIGKTMSFHKIDKEN